MNKLLAFTLLGITITYKAFGVTVSGKYITPKGGRPGVEFFSIDISKPRLYEPTFVDAEEYRKAYPLGKGNDTQLIAIFATNSKKAPSGEVAVILKPVDSEVEGLKEFSLF